MSMSGRAGTRARLLKRMGLVAGGLVVLTLLLLITGHWILTIIVGIAAAVAVWAFLQARTVN
jgi:hypothetical protein